MYSKNKSNTSMNEINNYGVKFDSKLHLKFHINNIIKKASA